MSKNKKYNKGISIKNEVIETLTKIRITCDSLLGQEEDIKKVLNGIVGQANFKRFQEITKSIKDFGDELSEDTSNQYKEIVSNFRLKDNQCIELLTSLKENFNNIIKCLKKQVTTREEAQILNDRIEIYRHSIQENLSELSVICSFLCFIGTTCLDLNNSNVDINTFDYTTLAIAWTIRDCIIMEFKMLEEKIRKHNEDIEILEEITRKYNEERNL